MRKMDKGLIAGMLVPIIMAGSLLLAAIASIYFLNIKIVGDIKMSFDHRNTQMALLSFLRSTYNGKSIYKVLAESYTRNESLTFLLPKLRLVGGKCFQFKVGDQVVEEGNCEFKYASKLYIPLPPSSKERFVEVTLMVG